MRGVIAWDILLLPGPLGLKVFSDLAVLYVVSWADAAMDQVLVGSPVPTRSWPLLPLQWARPQGARIFDSRIGSALERALSRLGVWVAAVVGIAIFWGGIWLIGRSPVGHIIAQIFHSIDQHLPWTGKAIGLIFIALTIIYFLVEIVRFLQRLAWVLHSTDPG
jgi:hypothetical protein